MQFNVVYLLLFVVKSIFGGDIILRSIKKCDTKTVINLQLNCKRIAEMHHCNLTLQTPIDLDDNVRAEATVNLLRGKRWFNVVNIKDEKGLCHIANTYVPTLVYVILRAAGRECPIKKGYIDVKDIQLDLKPVAALPFIPRGVLRLDLKATEKATGRSVLCTRIEAESVK